MNIPEAYQILGMGPVELPYMTFNQHSFFKNDLRYSLRKCR